MKDIKLLPLWVCIIAGCIALFGNFYNGNQSLKIEKKQFESNLILKSMVPGDSAQSIKNIRFLIKAGFISADNDKIIKLIKDTVYHIEFPKSDTLTIRPENGYQVNSGALFSAQVVDDGNKPLKDALISIFKYKTAGKAYAITKSDANGLFKVPYPDEEWVKVVITKEGYRHFAKLYIGRTLDSVRLIPLQKL